MLAGLGVWVLVRRCIASACMVCLDMVVTQGPLLRRPRRVPTLRTAVMLIHASISKRILKRDGAEVCCGVSAVIVRAACLQATT